MTDLATVLARMLIEGDNGYCDWEFPDDVEEFYGSPRELADSMADTPTGRALAALVEAAEDWERSIWVPDHIPSLQPPGWVTGEEDALKRAIDALRGMGPTDGG